MSDDRTARCACGRVELSLAGRPMVSAVCYCDDCQAGARQLQAAGATPAIAADGGTHMLMYRRDRVVVTRGANLLQGHKLKPGTPTNRVVAGCCNTPIMARFDRGPFWISVFATSVADAPPVEVRLQTRFRQSTLPFPDGAPTHARFPAWFALRLLRGGAAMALRL